MLPKSVTIFEKKYCLATFLFFGKGQKEEIKTLS